MAAGNTNFSRLRPAETIQLHSVASRPASLLPGAAADNYKYAKIRATEQIRLLSVLPQAASKEGIQSTEVRCQLDVYDRDDAPDYEALSYTWGDKRHRAKIICNSKSIWVTENCHKALQTLSARYAAQLASSRSPGPRNRFISKHRRNDSGVGQLPKLWIDAICINQEDYWERTGQVSIMGEIFHSAINTIVYLGELGELGDGDSSSLYRDTTQETGTSLQHTVGLMERIASLVPRSWNSHSVEDMLQPSLLLDILEASPEFCMAWRQFFGRQWFGRTWVLQEVILSRNVVVLLGDMALDWRAVQIFATIPEQVVRCADRFDRLAADDLVQTLQEHNFAKPAMIDTTPIAWPMPWKTELDQDDRFVVENETMRQATLSICPGSKSHLVPAPRSLFNFLEQSAGLECLDPRDKLFALLSLFERDTPAEIAISYVKTSKQVYIDLSWFLISHGIFEILSLAQGTMKTGLDSFPSWTVDWTAHPRPRRLALNPYKIPPSQSLLGPFDVTIKTIGDTLILRGRLLEDPISNTENRSSDTLRWFQDFRTETGIEGFGHRRLRPGDVPCLFRGYDIPILLRRRTDDTGWELVGECWLVFDVPENIRPGFDMDWSRTFPNVAQSAEQDIWIH